MAKSNVMVIRGKASYAMILGDPVLNYSKDGKEWKIDLVIDDDTAKEFKAAGLGDRVKSKATYLDGRKHVTFKQAEFRRDETPNKPINVMDILGEPWDQNTLIGNESDLEITFANQDYGPGKKNGMYIRSVRVLKLVPYAGKAAEPIKEDDPFYAEALAAKEKKAREAEQFKKDFGLEDPEPPFETEPDLDDPID